MITIVSRPVFLCPHRRLSPTNQTASFETQMIPMTPQVLGRTLRTRRQRSRLSMPPGGEYFFLPSIPALKYLAAS
jgi:hypothetical protein